eukprot:374080-Ditylum_brightwellii.AAC.1
MMICFSGRSTETHHMKDTAIREGYKFFILATTQGLVVTFEPDGRTVAKADTQEYAVKNYRGKLKP